MTIKGDLIKCQHDLAVYKERLAEADKEIERLREAMQEFVDRCDRGEVRSKYTYAKFKALLDTKAPNGEEAK